MLEEKFNIKNLIYEIRGKQVMLDSDLAILYQCKNGTKEINQAVKNNIDKFPERFSWILTDEESKNLLVKIFDQKDKIDTRGGKYKNPRVFTEQGVSMLATIIKSKVATKVSIGIMDAFVEMRKFINANLLEQKYINELVLKDSKRIDILEETFKAFNEKNHYLFFKGQKYDAYSLMINIFNKSKKSILIIDNYIDKNLLDILSKTEKKIIVITSNYNSKEYEKYIEQYDNVKLVISNEFHDRFIIIDKKIIYHCGSSFKDLGKSCFEISFIDDEEYLKLMLKRISKLLKIA